MGIWRWERGLARPPASCFVALGKMVGPPDGWYFCNLVGTGAADRKKMLGAAPGWRDL
ncbi:MAG TPA: hypothetical protein VE083_04320 [Terriglobales bacterium]|nr:hypothetical protein [Terriglobales bacterium]